MNPSSAIRRAAREAARRHRLQTDGTTAPATIVAVRHAGLLDGGVPLLEIDLCMRVEVDGQVRARQATVVDAVPLMLARRAVVGSTVTVLLGAGEDGDVVVEWSA